MRKIEMLGELQQKIELLLERQPDIFGASVHGYELNDRLEEWKIESFEHRHRITLPDDYRWFLTQVGNGGAGPYYGVFPLGSMDDGHEIASWDQENFIVGALSEPFLYTEQWNDLSGEPDDGLIETDEAEYEAQLERFEERYFSRVNGAIPICHMGCALRIWLVVTGPERGHLWLDKRADRAGFEPLAEEGSPRTSFLDWYQRWVDSSLLLPPTAETIDEAFARSAPEAVSEPKSFAERFRSWWRT